MHSIDAHIAFRNDSPEPGQLVEVRRRQWLVNEVAGSALGNIEGNGQAIVSLSSLDEDALGEELQVVWQIEPGARVLEQAGLPKATGWDSPSRLEAFLDAVRWGAVTNADKSFLQAPFRSGITIEDYQLDPLVRALEMARVSLLVADDVGLGKTIEAGLVIQEMLVRHRARTVFIVCPASLQYKWRDEMLEKFGLEFRIVDTAYVKQLRRERGLHVNPWTSFPRLITSMDWMKGGEGLRLIKDALPPHVTYPRAFDILVIDEAHNIAPSTLSNYALESQRTRLVRTIAPHFEHKLFLSATPHNGYQESFTSLLELLDNQRFARNVMPNEKQLQRVMVRRLKTDLVDSEGHRIYPLRKLLPLEVEYTEEERSIHKLLNEYAQNRAKSVAETRFAFGSDFINCLLKKRLFSSPMAFALTLSKHMDSLSRPRKDKRKSKELNERILYKAILQAQEDSSDDALIEERNDDAVDIVSEFAPPLDDIQKNQLQKLAGWANSAKNRVDSKAKALLKWLESHLKTEGKWNDKRVILFTEYRATLSWIEQILASNGYGGERLSILHGSVDTDEREKIKAAFQASPKISQVRILLATDAASEGIDLQNHCNYLIHIEIPWNPNVMEQRNGRIDRHGQKASEVYIWHPVGKGYSATPLDSKHSEGDQEYLWRAVKKVDTIREDLGSVGPVIAKQIEEAMLGKRITLDTDRAESKARDARKYVAAERKLQEKIARLHQRLMEAKTDFRLSPEHIERAVVTALELAEKPPLKPVTSHGFPAGKVFEVPVLPGSWGKATIGLEHPHTGQRRPITFDHDVAKGRDDIVLAHLNHKLVQMCLRLLREELWKLDDIKKLHRITVRASSDPTLEHPVACVWARLVVTGGDHRRLHEEVTLAGGEMKPKGFARIPQIGRVETLLNESAPIEPDSRVFERLVRVYGSQDESLRNAIQSRSKDRLKHLESTLDRRKGNEKADLLGVLDELEKTLRSELKEDRIPKQLLLPGLDDNEKNQMKKDIEALKARLARIPEERKLESEAIEKRFSGLTDHTFPVAVEFVVPKAWMGGRA